MSFSRHCKRALHNIAQLFSPLVIFVNRKEQFRVKRVKPLNRLTTILTNFKSPLCIEKSIRRKKMSVDSRQQPPLEKTKIIGFKVTEEELQNTIYPVMHDCYDLGIIDHDTTTAFLRFCVQFWMGHYRMKKKQQFDMSQQEIEQEEKKKLAAIIAEKEAWHKWDNSTPRE
jgi:hypothetical protein